MQNLAAQLQKCSCSLTKTCDDSDIGDVLTRHVMTIARQEAGTGLPVEAGFLDSRKEVVLWNMTVEANEVVLSSGSRRAVRLDSHQLVRITIVRCTAA